ncbi:MAG: hypothetical protein AAF638_09885 [Pseudomonadota bacterium]
MLPFSRITTLAETPSLADAHEELGATVWPEFMLNDPVAIANWPAMLTRFAAFQLCMEVDETLAVVANAVPLRVGVSFRDLHDRGVHWGLETAVAQSETGIEPNALMGVQVAIGAGFRGRGLSLPAAKAMIELARRHGLQHVILPVRPNGKAEFPLIPMADYMTWTRPDGLPFDAWLRVHARLGGTVHRICHQSMRIPGTVAEWTRWTGQRFPGSGDYVVDGALSPITIDMDRDLGVYLEPNVWISHAA